MPKNDIHPTAVIAGDVVLGSGNVVGPYAVLYGPLSIGDGNWIGAHCSIGTPAEWTGVTGTDLSAQAGNGVRIGDENVLREHVSVNQGTNRVTAIQNRSYLMSYSHVAHDSFIADDVTLTNAVQLAGHTHVGWRANLGLGTVVHQRKVIGPYVMAGMQSVVTDHLPPGVVAYGSPARPRGVNRIGLERAGFDTAEIAEIVAAFQERRRPDVARLDVAMYWFEERVAEER